jgi:D-sedoheptulose 7-phosphate isomerase
LGEVAKMIDKILERIVEAHSEGIKNLLALRDSLEQVAVEISKSLRYGGKLLIAGNGGSASQSQHLAAEIVGRYTKERMGYPAVALTTDTSIITAIGNDYGFNEIFRRQIEALGKRGDIFLAISTSGNSPNVLSAMEEAKKRGLVVVALTGRDGGKMKDLCDYHLNIPLKDTPRIQEFHEIIIHIIAELVELNLTGE